jgi:hypothetical protein
MSGLGLAGKSYSNYFNITEGGTANSPIDFSMKLFSNITEFERDSLIRDVSLIVTLRKDIIFDITATVKEGSVHVDVPFMVSVNNLVINTTEGDILYELNHCILEGNITGIANNGNIDLMANNPEYTRNTMWTYKSIAGDITIDINHINQNTTMNANITGSLIGNEYGDVILNYYDNTANIGAWIIVNNTIQALRDYGSDWEGFNRTFLKDLEGRTYGFEFTSTDFPAITNYNLFLEGIGLHSNPGTPPWGLYRVLLYSS